MNRLRQVFVTVVKDKICPFLAVIREETKGDRQLRTCLTDENRTDEDRLLQSTMAAGAGSCAQACVPGIQKAVGIQKGSGNPLRDKVGTLKQKDLEEIAKTKLPDLNANDLEAAKKIIAGTARSMGVEVEAK